MVKREEFWYKMSQCIGSIPYRENLVLGGDLNVQMTPMHPHVGHGTGTLSAERAPDTDAAHAVLSTHSLVALNTWGQHGSRAHTFAFGKHQAQLDYIIVRQRHSDSQARGAHPIQNCPVGAWRQGGGIHKPVAATLPFHCKVFHKPPTQAPGIDAEKIIQIARQGGPEADAQLARFRNDVADKIAPIRTVVEAGRLSLLVGEVARQHFPKMRESAHQTARWQQTEVKQGIKDMWKAWRLYRREDGRTRRIIRWRLCLGDGGLGRPTTNCTDDIEKGVEPPRKPTSLSKCTSPNKLPAATISAYCTRSFDRLRPNPGEAGHNLATPEDE